MPKRSTKPKLQKKDAPQLPRHLPDVVAPDIPPVMKLVPNKANPPRPAKKQDIKDIDRADAEGMAQPQGLPANRKNSAAVTLSPAKRKAITKKTAGKRRG